MDSEDVEGRVDEINNELRALLAVPPGYDEEEVVSLAYQVSALASERRRLQAWLEDQQPRGP